MFRSRNVILKDTYRLDVMRAGDQPTSTQTLLSLNALALSPTTQLAQINPRNVQ